MSEALSIALLFEKFGPYHLARLKAAKTYAQVVGVELRPRSVDYPWFEGGEGCDVVSLAGGEAAARGVFDKTYRAAVYDCLDGLKPRVVAIPGWSEPGALLALQWCRCRRVPAIIMCDSTLMDAPRCVVSEGVKKGVLKGVAAGFVSGTRSKYYLQSLGLPADRIFTGYDVVDNAHFSSGAEAARLNSEAARCALGLPSRYALFVGRLVEKKNVAMLLRAFSTYTRDAQDGAALDLVIVGDGALQGDLRTLASQLDGAGRVHFLGHAGYADLPALYGLADFFILPSIVDQWGLVVNEAIACGLPILVSSRCGASEDLVEHGRNGLVFDPSNVADLRDKIGRLARGCDLKSFGARSKEIAKTWDVASFGRGLQASASVAVEAGAPPGRLSYLTASALLLRSKVP